MAFKKDNKKGTGRPKGSGNKITQDARELFLETLEGLSPNVNKAFLAVLNGSVIDGKKTTPNPAKFLELFSKYAQYFVPKKTESDIKGSLVIEPFDIRTALSFTETKKQ